MRVPRKRPLGKGQIFVGGLLVVLCCFVSGVRGSVAIGCGTALVKVFYSLVLAPTARVLQEPQALKLCF